MKTDRCEFTIGVVPGYYNDHGPIYNFLNIIRGAFIARDFTHTVQDVSETICKETNIYISWNISKTKTVYRDKWGCPPNGESTYTLSAVRNPEFESDSEKWKDAVMKCINILKDIMGQKTVSVIFSEVEFYYLKDNKESNVSIEKINTITKTYPTAITKFIGKDIKRSIKDILAEVQSNTDCKISIDVIDIVSYNTNSPAQVIANQYIQGVEKVYYLQITVSFELDPDIPMSEHRLGSITQLLWGCYMTFLNKLVSVGYVVYGGEDK